MTKAPPPRLRRRWRQRSLLTALGIVFAVSAILRLGSIDFAFAEARREETPGAAADPGPARPADSEAFTALRTTFDEVEALRIELAAREAAVADRERAVAAAQSLLEAQMEELAVMEADLAALIATSDTAVEADLDQLTRLYETMDPDDAAGLFAQMGPHFAAGFIARMTPGAGAAILAAIPDEAAYAISVVLATRNASAPTFAPDMPPQPAADPQSR